jgi:hypothetical protein
MSVLGIRDDARKVDHILEFVAALIDGRVACGDVGTREGIAGALSFYGRA